MFIFLKLINDKSYDEYKFTFNSVINSLKLHKIKNPDILSGFFVFGTRVNSCHPSRPVADLIVVMWNILFSMKP
ncbi:hypothetical protein B9X76_01275 [Acinetobacter pittii]|nr:hypothetical protein B9X76_01275 [Acinetobacter pittii]